ncbi:MAG: hypothetical protein U0Y10_12100 [Spirosomataceae bacterium]
MKAFIFTLLFFAVGFGLSNAQDRTTLNLKKAYFQCPPCDTVGT